MFHRFQLVGPFLYVRMTLPPTRHGADSRPLHRGAQRVRWRAPLLEDVLRAAHPAILRRHRRDAAGTDLRRRSPSLWFYGLHQTFTSLALLFIPNLRLTAMLTEHMGDDVELPAFELTQGGDNATQAIDEEIWELAELARDTPAVREDLERGRRYVLRCAPNRRPPRSLPRSMSSSPATDGARRGGR